MKQKVKSIDYDHYPKQKVGSWGVGQRVCVYYKGDESRYHEGTIVRQDEEEPFETIIQLDNGRFLHTGEYEKWLLQ